MTDFQDKDHKEQSLIRALQDLLAGRVPSEHDTCLLTGEAKACLDALTTALHADGVQAVYRAFTALVKDRPWLGALASQAPDIADTDAGQSETSRGRGKKRGKGLQLTPKALDPQPVLTFLNENEYGDARLFAAVFAGQVCYDSTGKEWYLWAGHSWQRDNTGQVHQLVSGDLAAIYLHAVADLNTQHAAIELKQQTLRSQGVKETDEQITALKNEYNAIGAQMKELRERAWNLRGRKRCKNVMEYIAV